MTAETGAAAGRRTAEIRRQTRETTIELSLDVDGTGRADVSTGIGFLDHMLDLVARHGLFDLDVACKGDLHIDDHHSVEDIGITFGQAFAEALGDKKGIVRFGHAYVPMDETLVRTVVDLSGRSFFVYRVANVRPMIGALAVLALVAILAGYLPALRAAHVNPVVVLRAD